jgi:hypothetical protein
MGIKFILGLLHASLAMSGQAPSVVINDLPGLLLSASLDVSNLALERGVGVRGLKLGVNVTVPFLVLGLILAGEVLWVRLTDASGVTVRTA